MDTVELQPKIIKHLLSATINKNQNINNNNNAQFRNNNSQFGFNTWELNLF